MAENINVSISNDSVKAIIDAHVKTAVANALMPHSETFVREFVERSLLTINENSDRNRYKGAHQKVSVLQEIVEQCIAEEATKAIREWAESHREQIAKQIRTSISSNRFAKQWALKVVEDLVNASMTGYRWTVNVQPMGRE